MAQAPQCLASPTSSGRETGEVSYADEKILQELVTKYSRRLARELNDPACDETDVAQEFWVRLLPALKRYRRRQGELRRYATKLLKRQRASLIRARYAAKRSACSSARADARFKRKGADSSGEAVFTYGDLARRLGRAEQNAIDVFDRGHDIPIALITLKADDARLATLLMSTSIAEIARNEGIPRTSLHDRIRALRRPFEEAGLKDYLK